MQQRVIRIDRPSDTDFPVVGGTCHVAGLITGVGQPEPDDLESLLVQFSGQPAVEADFSLVITHPPQPQPHWTFQVDLPVPGPPGDTSVIVTAAFGSHDVVTASRAVTTHVGSGIASLAQVKITFNTHNDDKKADTALHVFVKNRSSTSATPEKATDYLTNLIAFQQAELAGPFDINPYLAAGQDLASGETFAKGSTRTVILPLRSAPVPVSEIVLPVVDIHIDPNSSDRWMFDYSVDFFFDDGHLFSYSSNTDGVTGIILDNHNPNYSGICIENPFNPQPLPAKPDAAAVLTRIALTFNTHDDNKNSTTQLNVHIANRLSATSNQDLAIASDVFSGQELPNPSTRTVLFSATDLPLASSAIRLGDMVLPVVYVNIVTHTPDRWMFDYEVTYTFSDGHTAYTFTSRTDGVALDRDNHKHAGVYQGPAFPTASPPQRANLNFDDQRTTTKTISLSYLNARLDEFVNQRPDEPLKKLRLHNFGGFGGSQPESFYDLRSIEADPPPPGQLPPGFIEGTTYSSSPASLKRLSHGVFFEDINTQQILAHIDSTRPTPLIVDVIFDVSPDHPTNFHGTLLGTVTQFSVEFRLTLGLDATTGLIDLMSWVAEIQHLNITTIQETTRVLGTFLGKHIDFTTSSFDQALATLIDQVINVKVTVPGKTSAGGAFQKQARRTIYDQIVAPDPFDGKSIRDRLNAAATRFILGGSVGGESGCSIQSVSVHDGSLDITYVGPSQTFVPPTPANWPSGVDFSPGHLANIDHIVVLTMENRSFDHMLGYLSLPPAQGGRGRTDVDGLKGGEFNLLNGSVCPSFPFAVRDTIFAPDPPHGYEPVQHAVNGGKMDGFVQAYAEEHGPAIAPRIMGYHTADNVPVYDALARDFAVGHRWFASHPGPTFCNRFYELTGRLNLDADGHWEYNNSHTMRTVFTPTMFDYLTAQQVSWKYFEHHYCFLRFFQKYTFDQTNLLAFDDPLQGFVTQARAGTLPSVTFIDPHFIELPPGGNCDGPPADIQAGQDLVRRVVNAIVTSPLWSKTLLIITYDEHGGFYDHVAPPLAPQVSPELLPTYGLRVPTFVVSPWVAAGSVFGHDGLNGAPPLYFDHTSILKTIARRFLNQNPPFMGARYAAANDLSSILTSVPREGVFGPYQLHAQPPAMAAAAGD